MIIFGWRTNRSVTARGSFDCPTCQTQTRYEHIHLKKWFTLFFIPLIPLGTKGSYVRCTGCGTNYRESILRRSGVPQAVTYGKLPPLPPEPPQPIAGAPAAGWAGSGTATPSAPSPTPPARPPQGPPSWN